MLEAIILYGRNTLICDLPHDPLELQNKLNSIGISVTADHIPLSDEDGSEIRVQSVVAAIYRSDITRDVTHFDMMDGWPKYLSDCNLLRLTDQEDLQSE